METLMVEVFDKKNSPKISLSRDINIEDFANVDERNNAILFILDDDKGWSFVGDKAILKIRFRLADTLKEKLEGYSKDAAIQSYAMNFWKVHRYEVKKSEATPEKEDELKDKTKKLVERSIQMLNCKADNSF